MAKVKRLRKSRGMALLIFLVLVIAVSVAYISNQYKSNLLEIIEYDFFVGDDVAFNLDSDKMHFGTIRRGARAFRTIVIEVDANYDVRIVNKGSDFLYLDEDGFFIGASEIKNLRVYVQVPRDAEERLYEGELLLMFNER